MRALTTICLILGSSCLTAASAAVSPTTRLQVRLLTAGHGRQSADTGGIQDVLPLLNRSLKFSAYRALATKDVPLEAGRQVRFDRDLTLTVGQNDGNALGVTIQRGTKRLLKTKLRLLPKKPIMLGGFPARDGRTLIIVLTIK